MNFLPTFTLLSFFVLASGVIVSNPKPSTQPTCHYTCPSGTSGGGSGATLTCTYSYTVDRKTTTGTCEYSADSGGLEHDTCGGKCPGSATKSCTVKRGGPGVPHAMRENVVPAPMVNIRRFHRKWSLHSNSHSY
ncbi:hypothetical protein JAAARDRAFT_40063 [Jaapia argillacea MUCL 33604]|uniref:Secreted protein n=1 Tax=Jaapia argillacea MUCL 33604 TaxID=933084 RepID=A0A067PCZ1_9AGAM|nr:hypothetical protein JAAARDRAFT_40063 [Jaapia argillacea MUCL 33604]